MHPSLPILILPFFTLQLLADPSTTTTPSTNQLLKISPSSTKVPGAKLTLTVGPLHKTNDTYTGDFQMKVTPFFFKNEKGIVTINLTDEAIRKAAAGQTIQIKGAAKTTGKNGPTRPLTATATPKDSQSGALAITIQDQDRTLHFQTDYKFQPE